MAFTDIQKKEVADLGPLPVKEALRRHSERLEVVSNQALDIMQQELPQASLDQATKIYDITRKHKNVIDQVGDPTGNKTQIYIIPQSLVINPEPIEGTSKPCEPKKKLSNSMKSKKKLPEIKQDSESLIVEDDLEKHSFQDMNLSPVQSK